jgi:hypothetical protein
MLRTNPGVGLARPWIRSAGWNPLTYVRTYVPTNGRGTHNHLPFQPGRPCVLVSPGDIYPSDTIPDSLVTEAQRRPVHHRQAP